MRCLAEDCCLLQGSKADDDGLALTGVYLVQQLQVFLVGGESHGVEVVVGLFEQHTLGQADHCYLGV